MMKKLTLLKPDKKQVFLDGGKGQAVNYINIPENINVSSLENDVKNGATHFKELLEFSKKRPAKVVVVDCTNEEQGLMAVTYLSAIYNKADKVCELPNNPEDDYETTEKSMDVEDYESYYDEDLINNEPSFEEEYDEWVENPFALPVITSSELINYSENEYSSSPFHENNFFLNGMGTNSNKKPYWLSLHKEPVCIVDDKRYNSQFGRPYERGNLSEKINRFCNNRHVYIVSIHDTYKNTEDENMGTNGPMYINPITIYKQDLYSLILEHTASLVEVKNNETEIKKYHRLLFDNWAGALGVSLAKGFPREKFVNQILQIRGENKSELIEKVYRYVISQDGTSKVLSLEDFDIISKFKAIGAIVEEKDDKQFLKKMEHELVGLEEVKAQIYGIVDVMKYHKKRAAMGYGTSGYHNVHLMIGAPGTAKTTMAQLLGNIMMEQKLLPGNRFVAINGADLKAMYVGHSAPKTKAYFDNNDIIFIDEAYSLTSEKDMDSFSQEALAQLVIELEKHGLDKLVIFAGYGGKDLDKKNNKMLQFIDANPGIRSRINSTIYFQSYTPDEMVNIVHSIAANSKFKLTTEGDELIKDYFTKRTISTDFGNGREARSLLENISFEAAKRVMRLEDSKQTKKAFSELVLSDVEAALNRMRKAHDMQNGIGYKNGSYGFLV